MKIKKFKKENNEEIKLNATEVIYSDIDTTLDLQTKIKKISDDVTSLNNSKLKWRAVSWSGTNTGGAITMNETLVGKFVSFGFVSTSNTSHRTHAVAYIVSTNNYFLTQMYGATKYITISSISSSGFNLTVDSGIQLASIYVLD